MINKKNIFSLYHDKKNKKIYDKIFDKNIIKKNSTDYSKIVVRKPWGYEYVIFQNVNVAITILYLNKNHQTSMHCHPNKTTSLIVLDGQINCEGFSKKYKVNVGQGIFIDKKVFHQSVNNSNKTCIIMEIETPNMKYDLLRYKDKYGRSKLGYEKSDYFSVNTNNYNLISLNSANTYHNLTKKFGKSSITFVNIKNKKDFFITLNKFSNSIFTILDGEINLNNNSLASGLSFESKSFVNNPGQVVIKGKLLILITKKNDDKIKASDLIIDTLANQNIDKAFLVAGDSNLHLLDSIGKKEKFNYKVFNDEYHASFAALGYSKLKLTPSVMIISSGHSSLKVVEAVCSAYIDSEPLIIISGQAIRGQNTHDRIRQLGNKSVNIINIVKKITNYSIKINHENDLVYHLEKAIFLSQNNRPGPVWIDIPIDLLGKILNEEKIRHFNASEIISNLIFKNLQQKINKVYSLLKLSKKPVLLIGYGVRLSKSQKQILDLINLLKIPVLTSRRGSDLIDSKNIYYFGRPGVYDHRYSNMIIQKSDLLISIGSRLSIPLIGRKSKDFANNAKKIIIDIDQNELEKKTLFPDYKINCSADVFIDSMIKYNVKLGLYKKWIQDCKKIKKILSFDKENYKHDKNINPYLFIKDLSSIIPDESIIFMDGNTIMNYTMQSFDIKKNQRLITASGLDSEGFSLPASLGLSAYDCKNFIIVLCDQTKVFSSIENFNMIMENKLPIKIFAFEGVKNIALRNSQKDFFGGRYVATKNVDFNNFLINNQSYSKIGIKFIKINSINYKKQITQIFNNKKPTIISVEVDPKHKILPKMGFSINYSGNWQPKSLGDMYPFLNKKTLKQLMSEI